MAKFVLLASVLVCVPLRRMPFDKSVRSLVFYFLFFNFKFVHVHLRCMILIGRFGLFKAKFVFFFGLINYISTSIVRFAAKSWLQKFHFGCHKTDLCENKEQYLHIMSK